MPGRHRWPALTVYVFAVTAAGLLLWVTLAMNGGVRAALGAPPVFWLLVAFLVASQIRTINIPRLGDLKEITTSVTFAWALLLAWGTAPAALALAAGSIVADAIERKAPRKVAFNAAQLTLALGAAGGVFALLGGRPPFSVGQLPALAVGALVFFLVNQLLVGGVVALAQGRAPTARRVWAQIRVEALPEAILAAMAPIVVVLAQRSVVLVLLLPLPMVGVYLACKAAIEADANRAAAEAAAAAARVVAAEQARLARAEQAVARQLQESERLKENLLATVSHELRTPLAGVLGAIATLEQRGNVLSPEVRQELVEIAARQGKRLKELIEELLLAATLEQIPSDRVPPRPVDASELARQACAAARVANPTQMIVLSENGALPVRAAPEAILQALTNLLDNAARYSPDGAPIRLEANRSGDHAVIAVEDAGPGVPPTERERIFERFMRLDHQIGGSPRGGGVGLGLYVARQLARAQGGILAMGEPLGAAGGARFELRLPLAGDPSEVEPVPRVGESAP